MFIAISVTHIDSLTNYKSLNSFTTTEKADPPQMTLTSLNQCPWLLNEGKLLKRAHIILSLNVWTASLLYVEEIRKKRSIINCRFRESHLM